MKWYQPMILSASSGVNLSEGSSFIILHNRRVTFLSRLVGSSPALYNCNLSFLHSFLCLDHKLGKSFDFPKYRPLLILLLWSTVHL